MGKLESGGERKGEKTSGLMSEEKGGQFLMSAALDSFRDNKQAWTDFHSQINTERGYPALCLMCASSSASQLHRGFLVLNKKTKQNTRELLFPATGSGPDRK